MTNETPTSIWKRPLRGPAGILVWFALLTSAIFVAMLCSGLLADKSAGAGQATLFALVAAVVLAGLASGVLLFLHWIFSWRNFRRFLIGVGCCLALVALAYLEENWRGKHAWEKHRRQWAAKGEILELSGLIPKEVPAEKNFALTPLLKPALDLTQTPTGTVWRDTNGVARLERISAELSVPRSTSDHLALGSLEKGTFADLAACREFYRGNTNYSQSTIPAQPAEGILVALGKFTPELQELHEAAVSRPYSRFPISYDFEPSWGILLPHLARIKSLTLLAHIRATAELEAGRSAEALEDLKLGFRLSDSIRDEPILIDHLVRIATLAINLQTVREGLVRHAWSDAQLAELDGYLKSVDVLAEYKLAIRGERALSVEGVDYLRREGFHGHPMCYLANEDGGSACFPGPEFAPGGWFYQNMLTISRMHQDFTLPVVDERARRVFPKLSEDGAQALQKMRTGPYTIFAKLLLPALERAVRKSARMQTYVDAGRAACALERYRLATSELADSLAFLAPRFMASIPKDVIDGQPLRYRRLSDGGYVLYSVGWNERDDGGVLAWTKETKQTSVDIAQGDWVWQMAAR